MRITQNMINDMARYQLSGMNSRLARIQEDLLSQRRVRRPSDDPAATAAALGFQTDLERIAQHLQSIEGATAWLNATDGALSAVTDALQEAREVAVQAASGTLASADQHTLGQEIGHLIDQIVAAGNTRHGSRYIFAGQQTDKAPFAVVAGGVAYAGDSGQILSEVDDQATMAINVSGDTAFPEVFRTLTDLRARVEAGDHAEVSSMIQDVDRAMDEVLAVRAQVGAKINRLAGTTSKLEAQKIGIMELNSKRIDTDMAAAITDYSTQQSVYQAALKVSARSLQSSLLDYLR